MNALVRWDSGLNADSFQIQPGEADCPPYNGGRPPRQGILAACLLRVGSRVLLSRRAISPRTGFWTIPGGYVEPGESTERGACRELEEEAGVVVQRARLIGVYEMPQISQVLFLYTAFTEHCVPRAGSESSEVSLCLPGNAPRDRLAFATDRRALHRLRQPASFDTVEHGQFHWSGDGRIHLESLAEQPSANE